MFHRVGAVAALERDEPRDVMRIRNGIKETRVKRLRDKVNSGRFKDTASSVLRSVQTVPRESSVAARAAVGRATRYEDA